MATSCRSPLTSAVMIAVAGDGSDLLPSELEIGAVSAALIEQRHDLLHAAAVDGRHVRLYLAGQLCELRCHAGLDLRFNLTRSRHCGGGDRLRFGLRNVS